tara:strand:- start:1629 stop:2231 length:603 start_codon:yes stop_codon:yes gene_type:complete
MQPHKLLLAALLLALPCLSSAANLQPNPKPGLWLSEENTLVNGRDILQELKEMRQAMMKSLPKDQRAHARAILGDDDPSSKHKCFTPEMAAALTTPEAILAEANQQMPECEFTTQQTSGNSLQFSGQCNDPEGFIGDMHGAVEIVSSTEIKSTFQGTGSYKPPTGMLRDGKDRSDITMENTSVSHWVADDCGTVEPQTAR